jgi:hypothetical protein
VLAERNPDDLRLLAACTLQRLAARLRGVERLPKLRPQDDGVSQVVVDPAYLTRVKRIT